MSDALRDGLLMLVTGLLALGAFGFYLVVVLP